MAPDPVTAHAPLAVTERSGHPESVHHGSLVALDATGRVVLSIGDPQLPVYPRSAMKPLQATAMVAAGLTLSPELLALVCASHDGRPEHLAGVRRILTRAGLDETALGNTPDRPLDPEAADDAVRAGIERSPLQMNCSGKHAGMLLTCIANGWPTDASYLDPGHPLQETITDRLTALCGHPASHIGVDGCGAPAHVLTLLGLARAFATIASGGAGAAGSDVHAAMSRHPEMVGGPTRDVTLLMRAIPGLMAKDGAEGVYAAALPDGRAVALKVADGANRPRPVAMVAALAALGVDVSAVPAAARESVVLGHGRPVGRVRALGVLADALHEAGDGTAP
jgi:L-asparaginase II